VGSERPARWAWVIVGADVRQWFIIWTERSFAAPEARVLRQYLSALFCALAYILL